MPCLEVYLQFGYEYKTNTSLILSGEAKNLRDCEVLNDRILEYLLPVYCYLISLFLEIQISKSKVGNRNRGWTGGILFNS